MTISQSIARGKAIRTKQDLLAGDLQACAAKGLSLTATSRYLADRGHLTKTGRAFSSTYVQRLLSECGLPDRSDPARKGIGGRKRRASQ